MTPIERALRTLASNLRYLPYKNVVTNGADEIARLTKELAEVQKQLAAVQAPAKL